MLSSFAVSAACAWAAGTTKAPAANASKPAIAARRYGCIARAFIQFNPITLHPYNRNLLSVVTANDALHETRKALLCPVDATNMVLHRTRSCASPDAAKPQRSTAWP